MLVRQDSAAAFDSCFLREAHSRAGSRRENQHVVGQGFIVRQRNLVISDGCDGPAETEVEASVCEDLLHITGRSLSQDAGQHPGREVDDDDRFGLVVERFGCLKPDQSCSEDHDLRLPAFFVNPVHNVSDALGVRKLCERKIILSRFKPSDRRHERRRARGDHGLVEHDGLTVRKLRGLVFAVYRFDAVVRSQQRRHAVIVVKVGIPVNHILRFDAPL